MTAEALRARHGPNYRWWVLLTVMVGAMASIMSSTIVNVALPDMSRVFTLGQERAQWMAAGFMASMTVSMLTTPWLLGRFGYRHTYMGTAMLLMAGGIGGGFGRSYDWVMAMRVVEGLAAGVMQPIPAIIVMRSFAPHEQGRAMGVFGMGAVLAPAVGPSIGGVLVEHFGWRSIFFVVVPFCIAALGLSRRYLPTAPPGPRAEARLDLPSLGLMGLTILLLLNGMVQLRGATPAALPLGALLLLALAGAGFAAFVAYQRRAAAPLLNLALFRHPSFVAGSWVAFIYGMALFGSTYLVPVFMQIGLQLPPSQAGAVLFPAGLALACTIPLAGRLADRLPIRRLLVTGVLVLALSFALMLGVGLGSALWVIALWAVVGRVGLGFVLPSLNLGSMRGLPPELLAQGSSTINFLRQLGGAVGVSLMGIFLEWRLHAHGAGLAAGSAAAGRVPAFHRSRCWPRSPRPRPSPPGACGCRRPDQRPRPTRRGQRWCAGCGWADGGFRAPCDCCRAADRSAFGSQDISPLDAATGACPASITVATAFLRTTRFVVMTLLPRSPAVVRRGAPGRAAGRLAARLHEASTDRRRT